MRHLTLLIGFLAGLTSGCNFFSMTTTGVGAKVAPSKAMENRGSPQKSKLVHGFLERLPSDTETNAWVVLTSLDNNLVASVSVGRQGYYTVFAPPGSYRISVYLDRDGDRVIAPHELAGQSPEPFTVPKGPRVAFFGLDLRLDKNVHAGPSGMVQVLAQKMPLDEGIPEMDAAEELYAPQFGQQNVDLGTFQSTVSFFSHVSPIQYLDEVDLTSDRVPMLMVHGISDSPQIFYEFEQRIPRARFEPLFYFYPTGARLPAMAELFHHLFLSGKVLPTFTRSVIIAHSMGGLVARSSLNELSNRPGESTVCFYGSFVSPYGGVPLAESGITSGPVIVPSWIDMSPERDFLIHLFKPLPPGVVFAMAQGNANGKSDGVIALSSQARPAAVAQAKHVQVFPATHVGIMSDAKALDTMLDWVQESLPALPEGSAPGGDSLARLDNLELRRRAHALRGALRDRFAPQGVRVFVSLVTPTVARLRLVNSRDSVILHLSVGQGIRLDEQGAHQALLFEPWPQDQSALDAVAERMVQIVGAKLNDDRVSSEGPSIPAALQFQSQPSPKSAEKEPDELARWTPPPVVLSSGVGFAINSNGQAPQIQLPLKLDTYFGYWGFGFDARFTVWGALIKSSQTNILFEPLALAAGPRLRFGHRSARLTGQVGVSGGVEMGMATFLAPSAGRISNGDDELDRQFKALANVYGSVGLGYRILQDFYGIALADLGVKFPPKQIHLPNDVTLQLSTTGLIRVVLGVEVRLP